jgi:hypothetical protein
MSDKQYVVPEAGLKAALDRFGSRHPFSEDIARMLLEAFIRWLSENPIMPTEEQWAACLASYDDAGKSGYECGVWFMQEWQRRMFLAPEPEVPEAIKNLLWNTENGQDTGLAHNSAVIEAFRRGQQSVQTLHNPSTGQEA